MSGAQSSSYVEVPVLNPRFGLRDNGEVFRKKATNFQNVAAWESSSDKHDCVGVEKGAQGRNVSMVCYLNGGNWVQQHLDHKIQPGKFYTIKVDAVRSAERAENILVEIFSKTANSFDRLYEEKVSGIARHWQEFSCQWKSPDDCSGSLTIRLTLCEPWGQFDNVRVFCGDTANAEEEAEGTPEETSSGSATTLPFDEGAPLNSGWSIWEHRKQGKGMTMGKEYMAGMARIADFKTVQGFWQFWNQLPLPSEFFTNKAGHKRVFEDRELEALSVFREGIEPMWEDSMNTDGGEWYFRRQLFPDELDKFWEELVLGCIGETVDEGNEICGVRVVDKSKGSRVAYRLEMWFRRNDPVINERLKSGMAKCLASVAGKRGAPDLSFRAHKG